MEMKTQAMRKPYKSNSARRIKTNSARRIKKKKTNATVDYVSQEEVTRKRKYIALSGNASKGDMLLEEVDALRREKSSADTTDTVSPVLYIHNLVGTGMVRSSNGLLDLKCMSSLIPNSVFHKQKFAAITIRLESPTCTALLFTSGKMVLTGCKTYIECIACALQVVALLRNNMRGTKFQLCSVCIQNMVGNVDLSLRDGARVNLHRMQSDHGLYCTYQKKMFPGLIYRPDNSPIVLLIFTSGKIVVTGGKSVCDMQAGWNVLWPFVQRYVTQT